MAEQTLESLQDILRSVLLSSKGGIPLWKLPGEYKVLTGILIPFQRFGFPTLDAFLRSMPHVVRVQSGPNGELVVHAVANDKTEHIQDLISRQKPSKGRTVSKPRRLMGNKSWHPPFTPHRSYNPLPSRPFSRYSPRPPLPRGPVFDNSRNNFRGNYQSGANNVPGSYAVRQNRSFDNRPVSQGGPNRRPPLLSQPVPPKPELAPRFQKQQQIPPPRVDPERNQQQRPQSPEEAKWGMKPLHSTEKSTVPVEWTTAQPLPPSRPASISVFTPPSSTPVSPPAVRTPTFANAPSHFTTSTSHFPPSSPNLPTTPTLPSAAPPYFPVCPASPSAVEPGLPWPNPKTNLELVENYAFSNGLKCVYRPMQQEKKKGQPYGTWLSLLILGEQKFNSYPNEFKTSAEANEEAANRAVEKLKIEANTMTLPVVSIQDNFELNTVVDLIREIVAESSGAYHYYVQEQFKRSHKKRLPPDWLKMVESLGTFRIDKADETHYILFNETSARSTPDFVQGKTNGSVALHSPAAESSEYDNTEPQFFPEPLTLPDSKYWDVYICYAKNTAEISFRLVDQTVQYDLMAESMELFYETRRGQGFLQPISEPVSGAIYCAFIQDSWHRICVDEIRHDGMVFCLFVDNGDFEYLHPNTLFELDRAFLDLPFQALRADLTGLGCFSGDGIITERLVKMILGKSLVAERLQREKSDDLDESDEDEGISLILHDTTTEDDININEAVLNSIIADIKTPVLGLPVTQSVVEGTLTAILPNGDIMVQVVDRSLHLAQLLIDAVVDIFERDRNSLTQISPFNMYCVKVRDKWYRAIPISADISKDNTVSMHLLEFGYPQDIPLENVCELGGAMDTLKQFPPLALRCQLHGVRLARDTHWTKDVSIKLHQMIPEGTTLLIKVTSQLESNSCPTVDLFKRLEPNKELVSINQTLFVDFPKLQSGLPDVAALDSNSLVDTTISRPNAFVSPMMGLPGTLLPDLDPDLPPSASYVFKDNLIKSTTTYTPPAVTSPVFQCATATPSSSLPGSASITNNNNIFSFGPMQEFLVSSTTTEPEEWPTQQQIPKIGEFFDVHITSVASPDSFTCRSMAMVPAYSKMLDEMYEFYSHEENFIDMDPCLMVVGKFFAMKRQDGWHRVYLTQIISKEPIVLQFYLVDTGFFEITSDLQDVQPLYKTFCALPYQAITASLAGVKLINSSTAEILAFKDMVEDKNFVSKICASKVEDRSGLNGVHLSLDLIDTSSSVDVYIHKELINMGIAKKS